MNLLGNDIAEVVHLLTKKLGVDLNDLSVGLDKLDPDVKAIGNQCRCKKRLRTGRDSDDSADDPRIQGKIEDRLSVALYNDTGDVPFIYQLLDFFHELFGLRLEFIFSSIISRYFLLSILFSNLNGVYLMGLKSPNYSHIFGIRRSFYTC